MASDCPVSASRVALAHLLSAVICFQAPREISYEKMQKSWQVAKFFGIRNFHSKFFEKLVLTWESTCKCNPSLGKDLKTCQTFRLVFRCEQYQNVLVDLQSDVPSTALDLQFCPGEMIPVFLKSDL